MGSLGADERDQKELVVSQVSFGGFDERVSAKDLTDFLEHEAGLIWRCRVKNSWTPPESYPDYDVLDVSDVRRKDDYPKVVPHAFVHFATLDAAKRAINAAGKCELVLQGCPLRANSGTDSSFRISRRRTMDPFRFTDVGVEIGTLASRDEFLVAWKGPKSGVDFLIDPFDGRCRILFSKETAFAFKDIKEMAVLKCDFKVEFLARDINEVKLFTDQYPPAMLFQLASTPWVYYRTADDDILVTAPFSLLDDEDPWIRTTDFTPGGAISRCCSYRISFSPRYGRILKESLAYLKERRIAEHRPKRPLVVLEEPDFGTLMPDPFFSVQHKEGISFSIMFLVDALVHKGIVNQHQLSEEFFALLRSQSDSMNETALRHIWAYKTPIFDACRRLKLVQDWLLKNPKFLKSSKLSDDSSEVRRLVITPTKAYCLPPGVELSNRVLRNYKEVADRFLRVTFMDEGMQKLNNNVLNYYVAPIVKELTSNSFPQKTTVFRRVRSILIDGFHLCGRRYSFLAFSSNQLRDRSAWFFAEDSNTSVEDIRDWMGKFANKNVAKCAARMGQCFSSTYATVDVPPDQVNPLLPDIERKGYIFSDGIGKITPELAMEVAEKLQLTENPPSAYQIRYAGTKGVVAVWPGDDDGIRLSLRPSMNKFESSHTMLEVVSWTRFQPGFLNRQIVTLLSSLNVPDSVFASMQDSMIYKLNQMLVDTDVAFDVLTSSCAEQGNTAAIMLSAGFKPQTEPHLKAMLSCIRSAQLGDLLAKARIFVPKGRWLMGCLDELGVLEHGQCFIQSSIPSLENCFMKHGSRFSGIKKNRQVIVGTVAIAKNPCLHPGDIRILEAVDVPSLHHLVDCLVFPQKGDRPHANEASGSDLDGDLYFVTWDENLIPPGKKSWIPMDYTPAKPKLEPRGVTPRDIIDFFLKNMVNENLGVICNAHVVHADCSEYGALDEKCLQLAELAATAVDFPKTGKLVMMPPALKPKVYPDFMGKDDHMSYQSQKVLGILYRNIKDATDNDVSSELLCTAEELPYDADLDIPGASDYLADAWQNKCSYDGQLNALLAQYRVRSEGEVVTGHIWSLPKYNSRKQGELKERLRNAYSALHKEFRRIFENMGPDFQQLTDDEKCLSYEQKASAWYQVTYQPRWIKKLSEIEEADGDAVPARLSFAWIAADYLVRIKIRSGDRGRFDNKRPIDTLACYLSERI
ncbi:probable RNA-dependent RNA polymerase SHL2 [Phoenix dactylifera]|uniref:RNA-dependent RNA polymerase n=1 Tax=Phoenix dactylifera TaxID=42345 RepID=A0A8B7BJX2_PHODC|nr:probable RNA-dependent RNA polymerase SHL2 [Phoenix dactylifera]XP_038979632.1 probable RNA-dependent RNA polymerase SHL2 [Phoenix dactylifera]